MHEDAAIYSDDSKKPDIILFYNSTKGGVDTIDQMCRHYTAKPETRRWPMAVFYAMLNIEALNAYVIWTEANPGWPSSSTSALRHSRKTFWKNSIEGAVFAANYAIRNRTFTTKWHKDCNTDGCRTQRMWTIDPPSTSHLCVETGRCYMCLTETHGAAHKKRFNLNSRVRTRCASDNNWPCLFKLLHNVTLQATNLTNINILNHLFLIILQIYIVNENKDKIL